MMRQVVVTGLGVVSPLGVGKREHWDSLVSPRSAIARSERESVSAEQSASTSGGAPTRRMNGFSASLGSIALKLRIRSSPPKKTAAPT